MKKRIVIIGAAGHAKSVCDVIDATQQLELVGWLDHQFPVGHLLLGRPVLGDDQKATELFRTHQIQGYMIGIGVNFIRALVAEKYSKLDIDAEPVCAIHPTANVSKHSRLGPGTVVMANATINVDSQIDEHCVINTGAVVEHDCIMESFASVSPSATLGGGCRLGKRSFLGIGATVRHGIEIGNDCVVGAGSVVVDNIANLQVAYGVPAKSVRQRPHDEKYL